MTPKRRTRMGFLAISCLSVFAMSACSNSPVEISSVAQSAATASSASSAAPSSSHSAPNSSPAPSSANNGLESPTSRVDPPVASTCGTVTAASGLTLQVLSSATMGIDCGEAKRIVGEFHQKISGRQSSDSQQPASDTVDGWLCVSGAPSAQGGTTCSSGERTIFAAVIPVE